MNQPTTPAPDLTALADAELIDLLMGAGLLMLAAQSNGDESGRQDEGRRMHDLRAELMRRLTRAAEPDAGRVTISEGSAVVLWNAIWEKVLAHAATQAQIEAHKELSGVLGCIAALAQAGTEGETE
jgi:hypothetical protein